MTITNTILDYVKIGLLFMIFSLPVFTIGAAATAGMTVALKIEQGEAPVVWKTFIKAFKLNFKQATIVAIMLIALFSILGLDWYYVLEMESTFFVKGIRFLVVILTLLLTMISLYLFSNLAKFELKTRDAFRNAVIYSITNFPKNLVAVAIMMVGILGYYYVRTSVPLVICFIPALEFFYMAKICVKTFRRLEEKTIE